MQIKLQNVIKQLITELNNMTAPDSCCHFIFPFSPVISTESLSYMRHSAAGACNDRP